MTRFFKNRKIQDMAASHNANGVGPTPVLRGLCCFLSEKKHEKRFLK
jgi:hypothetical protein